jgi:hypothetical protein
MSVLFISEATLKASSVINENVDNKVLTPLIIECQDLYIHPVIGTGLFNELKDQITNSTVTALNKTLLDSYIIPCLKAFIKYELPMELNFKFTNKNVGKKNSEDSQPISSDEMRELMNRYKLKAQWYAERITRYLEQNYPDYPLYINPGTGWDVIRPVRNNFRTGFVLGDDICGQCGMCECKCIEWGNLTIDLT